MKRHKTQGARLKARGMKHKVKTKVSAFVFLLPDPPAAENLTPGTSRLGA
jgi:hypothetical protein